MSDLVIAGGVMPDNAGASGLADACLDRLQQVWHTAGSRLLAVGRFGEEVLAAALRRGFRGETWASGPGPAPSFDQCVAIEAMEHEPDPVRWLCELHDRLRPDGVLLLTIRPSALMKPPWAGHSFDAGRDLRKGTRLALEHLLVPAGFRDIEFGPLHGGRGPSTAVFVLARAGPRRARPLLSVIMPVYNERRTVAVVLDRVLAKSISGMDKEVIVVESNSTDGSRDAVLAFEGRSRVQVVLQDRPRGKGAAVREGLRHATGDFILIQDADLEYDVDDYDAVLEPLRRYREAFVLGSRHDPGGMRVFTEQRRLGQFMNFGHIVLTGFFNLLYGQRLRDPWTMYKAFRAECLHGLEFHSNRFNFDVELVAKLVRKGYTPLEVPVRYKSRSFKDGKKVNVVRDPWTWLWACLKYRCF